MFLIEKNQERREAEKKKQIEEQRKIKPMQNQQQAGVSNIVKTAGSDLGDKLDAILSETEEEDGFNSRKPLNVDVMTSGKKRAARGGSPKKVTPTMSPRQGPRKRESTMKAAMKGRPPAITVNGK